MKKIKKTITLAGISLLLCSGAQTVGTGTENLPDLLPALCKTAYAASPAWLEDVDSASSDDTIAYGIYIGKPMQSVVDEFLGKGWTRTDEDSKVVLTKNKGRYIQLIVLHHHTSNKDLVGSYRIRFRVKDKTEAEDMYMHAEKNFSYNFGRPTFTKGSDNRTWVMNESFAIIVEFNEYNTRIAAAKNYPYEVVIKREMGDYKQFLMPGQ